MFWTGIKKKIKVEQKTDLAMDGAGIPTQAVFLATIYLGQKMGMEKIGQVYQKIKHTHPQSTDFTTF